MDNKKLIDFNALETFAEGLKSKLDALKEEIVPSRAIYKPAGSVSSLTQDMLIESNLGNVYNVTTQFSTNENFVEGSGKTYPDGTNVAIVDVGSGTYKFDVYSGFVDLSNYVTSESLEPYMKTEDFKTNFDSNLADEIIDSSEIQQMIREIFDEV